MKLHSLVVDDFLEDFAGWRAWADTLDYAEVTNPADGVSYPGIFTAVPGWGIRQRLSGLMGRDVRLHTLFLRLSLQDVPVPHQAHTDAVMGELSLMCYLNRPEHCRGGTELVRHVSGMDANPRSEEERALWERDTNSPDVWHAYSRCEMRPNRAFIFDAALMHRAMPLYGFGSNATDGRLVMTAFFS